MEKEMSAKSETVKLEAAIKLGDTVTLDKLSRSEYKTVRVPAQEALNKIDGLVDEKGKKATEPLAKAERVAEAKESVGGWIDCTPAQAKEFEAQGVLIGYNPNNNKAKIQ
jgi:hypothetical protein